MKAPALVFALSFSLVGLTACEVAEPKCSAATCSTGCCDSAGICQAGAFPQACGTSGFTCQACSGNSLCQFGQCVGGSTSGGSTGGGSGGGTGGGGGTCTPRSCVEQQKNCGEVSDGCGGTLQCGNCEVQGEACGAGGTANVCAAGTCTPTTCAQLGKTCGSVSDGCGTLLNCGTCTAPQVCSSMNVCQQSTCTPRTCAELAKNCGAVSNGCSGQLNCGTCTSPQTCGGGGVNNVCGGGACTPRTCAQAGATCGSISDNCGNMISCGSCTAPATCGGTGSPNTCGAPCVGSCPSGFTCMSGTGACAGGDLTNVLFDIPVPPQHVVSGRLTRNAAVPSATNCTSGYAFETLRFEHTTDTRFNQSLTVRCTASGVSDFAFTGNFYPGAYKVTAEPTQYVNMTNLPTWNTIVATAFSVTAAQTNVVFDIPVPPQHVVSGRITRNAAVPSATNCTSGYAFETLRFEHTTDTRFNQSLTIRCTASAMSDFAFAGNFYPGTYKVTAEPTQYVNMTNLPTWDTIVATSFSVSAAQTNVVFDVPVPPQHVVSGRITRNAAVPSATNCTSGYAFETLRFEHTTDTRFNQSLTIRCTASGVSDFAFAGNFYPGAYKVTAEPTQYVNMTNLPTWNTIVATSFSVTAAQTNVVFDVPVPPQHVVSGRITRNAMVPSATNCTSGYAFETLRFEHTTDSRFNQSLTIRCTASAMSDFAFAGNFYPGTYKVTAEPTQYVNMTNLPTWNTIVATSFSVSAAQTNVVFDVPVPPQHAVTGRITRNGSVPSATNCTSGYAFETLRFEHTTDSRFNQSLTIRCTASAMSDFAFTGNFYPGTYEVTAEPTQYVNMTNLPTWDTVVSTSFSVTAAQSNVVFDIPVPPQHVVSGRITRNSVVPSAANCTSGYAFLTLRFDHTTDSRFDQSLTVRCTASAMSDFAFTGNFYPGTYKVTAEPTQYVNMTNLPTWNTVVVNALQVP